MNPWRDHAVPAMRREALYGDRIVRCFVERPARLLAMFERRARAARPSTRRSSAKAGAGAIAQTGAEAERIAAGLAARGIGAGDRVADAALATGRSSCSCCSPLQRLGAIAVPVGVREQRPGLAYIAEQCGATAIVFDDALAERVPLPEEAPALAPAAGGVQPRRGRPTGAQRRAARGTRPRPTPP